MADERKHLNINWKISICQKDEGSDANSIRVRVASIRWKLVIFYRESNHLLNASVIFETETKVLAPSEWPWSAAAQGKDSIEFQFPIQ
jgi:hypothetical protein